MRVDNDMDLFGMGFRHERCRAGSTSAGCD